MAIPELSPEARAEALEKAKAARIKRAQVREELKAGKLTVAQVLDMREDPIVGRMKISTLIETLPGYGKAKAERIMRELQIAESRRITLLYGQLTAVCDEEGVPPIALTPGPDEYLSGAPSLSSGGDPARDLDQLMNEFDQVIRRDRTRGLFSDFFGAPPQNQTPGAEGVPGDPRAPLPVGGDPCLLYTSPSPRDM